ncbi:MAG: oxidative damage protection protein [Gemmatimonadetes bacterium]|nr:oxidative damage protection protein [Gemmatimonadota bacterium]
MSAETIRCRRCGTEGPKLERPPFRTDLGSRIHEEICQACWAEWLQHQTRLINHYGLDLRDARAREFLYAQIDGALFRDKGAEQVDSSQEGQIEW